MKINPLKLSIILLIIGLFLGACGKSTPANEGPATQMHISASQTSLSDMQTDISRFNSFTMESVIEVLDGETGDLLHTITTKRNYRQDPPAEQVVMEQKSNGEGAHGSAVNKTLELVTLNGVTYSLGHTTGCMTMPADDAETDSSLTFLDATTLLDSLQNAQRLSPDVTINSVQCKHYRFDESVYAPQNEDGVDVEGHLYLAASDNHLVRLTIEGIDPQMAKEEGITADDRFRLEYNVLSVNQPVEITIPADCEEQARETTGLAGYPVLDDAYHVLEQDTTLTYKTKTASEQILAFYQKALAEQGWTYNAAETIVGEAGSIWFFGRGAESLQIMVGAKNDATTVSLSTGQVDKPAEPAEPLKSEPLPHTPDAFDILSLSDTEIYKTHATTEDILAFYQEVLVEQGWEFDPEATLTNETGTAWFFKQEKKEEALIRVLTASEGDNTIVTAQWIYK